MNVRLLRRIQKHILKQPKRYDQYVWAETYFADETLRPPCGTAACIAGWACILTGSKPEDLVSEKINVVRKAQRVLGISSQEMAWRLFSSPDTTDFIYSTDEGRKRMWPFRFSERYEASKTPRGRARVGAERIDHFIKTKGLE